MKRYLPFVIVISVGIITIVSATMLYRVKRHALSSVASTSAATLAKKSGEHGIERVQPVHVRGNPNAPIILEEFGDFECPPCGGMAGFIKSLETAYGDRLGVVFNNFPLVNNHPHARAAALAAEAAALQNKFWEMHDLLYREQVIWSKAKDVPALLKSYAGILGLDLNRFEKDMESPETGNKVDGDHKRGEALGVTNTPTIFLNDNMVAPADLNPQGIESAIKKLMNEKETH